MARDIRNKEAQLGCREDLALWDPGTIEGGWRREKHTIGRTVGHRCVLL
jgi:hypothetical protein